MATEYTFSIIKPDITARNLTGTVNSFLELSGLKIVAQKMCILTKQQAKDFYKEHCDRPFFNDLIEQITAGPVVLQVLKGKNAIKLNREIMGDTDPRNAADGTIRKKLGLSIGQNSIHGSDSAESALREINFFFSKSDLLE